MKNQRFLKSQIMYLYKMPCGRLFYANLPETFSKYFIKTKERHHHKTRTTSNNGAAVQEVNSETYGNDSEISVTSKLI